MQIAPAGDRALLLTLGDVTAAELHATVAAARALPHVLAAVPGHASVLVVFEGKPDVLAVANVAPAAPAVVGDRGGRRDIIPVRFDGTDLPELLPRAPDFFERIETLTLTVRYLGFRGGFAYLDGWPAEWAMPRRPTSRPVKKGSFAIGGTMAGFYPIDTPGGWNILGHTGEELENRFRAGDEIRITRDR
jgi:allophanate hydrolase subunit 1